MHADYQSAHRREDRRQRTLCACICLLCSMLFVTILLICITVGIRYSGSRDMLTYSSTLGDSRIISYNSFLCSGGTMSSSTSEFPNTAMYFLDEEPPLSGTNVVLMARTFVLNPAYVEGYYDYYSYGEGVIVYVSWQFHLNPGSVILIQSCASNGPVSFAVVQGSSNYNRWTGHPTSYYSYQVDLQECGSGNNPSLSFTVQEEGYYYLVYYASSGTPTVGMVMYITRTEYSIEGLSGMPNCTLGSDLSCNAQSQSSSNYILFQSVPPNNANITNVQEFDLEWECDSKDGAYVLIFFFPLIVLALLFCGCFGIYCICERCFCNSNYDELHEDHAHIHAKPVSEKPPPPPYSAGPL